MKINFMRDLQTVHFGIFPKMLLNFLSSKFDTVSCTCPKT